ncbi:MAG TPA: alpha-ketoglutarate-dependent dioxygenase AlkB, partial [Burkholderiaceae bacterium]|nr:alpha-ketoglutarate-dependent dioxygenase AlkB [Burkholderiaceae bacterium]
MVRARAAQTEALFRELDEQAPAPPARETLGPGAVLLRRWVVSQAPGMLADLRGVLAQAPLRHMVTPGGLRMSVAMTNCGALGWVSDRSGYRYADADPESGSRWPAMPASFVKVAREAAAEAGFPS